MLGKNLGQGEVRPEPWRVKVGGKLRCTNASIARQAVLAIFPAFAAVLQVAVQVATTSRAAAGFTGAARALPKARTSPTPTHGIACAIAVVAARAGPLTLGGHVRQVIVIVGTAAEQRVASEQAN